MQKSNFGLTFGQLTTSYIGLIQTTYFRNFRREIQLLHSSYKNILARIKK